MNFQEEKKDTPIRLLERPNNGKGKDRLCELMLSRIQSNPMQPRKYFDDQKIIELAESIKSNGIIQPIIVSPNGVSGQYNLIAGERRFRAAGLAGFNTIPAIVREVSDVENLETAIVENIQWENLNPIEEGRAIERLVIEFGLTKEECAKRLGKDRSSVANLLRILTLPDSIQEKIASSQVTLGHAKVILSLEGDVLRCSLCDVIIKNSLTVRQADRLAKSMRNAQKSNSNDTNNNSNHSRNPNLDYILELLRERLRTKVRFIGSSRRGKLEISFFSQADLERLVEALGLAGED